MEMSALYDKQLIELIRMMVIAQQEQARHLKSIASSLAEIAHPSPNGFKLSVSSLDDGKNAMNLQIVDDGKGIVFTATPMKNGQPVALRAGQVPAWKVLDADGNDASNALNLSTSEDGLTATGTIPTPPVDGVGFKANISLTLSDNTVVTDDSDPFDIIQDPDNVDSFTIAESAA